MSPGRASSALTTLRPLLPCSALRTQVATAAQPPPGILCPAFSNDHAMNDAHHGLPGATPAAWRYSSTFGPVFVPTSRTPFCDWAMDSAAAPSELLPRPPGEAAAAASATGAGWAAAASAGASAGRLLSRPRASSSRSW